MTQTETSEKQQRGSALYDYGNTILYASRHDPRFSWCLYVPPDIHEPGPAPELIVSMHGTGRNVADYRNWFSDFGRWNRCVVLAPLFPAGVRGDGDRDGYKYIQEGEIRYDEVLLAMVAEVEERYGLRFPRFALWGFSGGGHFAHRFLLLHPQRLWAVSIGAPGSVTLLDPDHDWWVGTRDMQRLFGIAPDIAAMRRVAVHMAVGGADRETWEITHRPGTRHWMEGANDAGATRPDRLETLRRNFAAHGIEAQLDILPGVAHDGARVVTKAQDFFARRLRAMRAGTEGQA
ncbi:MAG TPA: alpha/beta hydrolase [Roseomonas sp.]|nr:alpha/beta hydrolase [Roseomonas sp.]